MKNKEIFFRRTLKRSEVNKSGSAKVGVISKAQNCKKEDPLRFVKLQLAAKYSRKLKGDPLGIFEKILKNFKIEIFEKCHSAKKCNGGTLRDFLTSIVLQNIKH